MDNEEKPSVKEKSKKKACDTKFKRVQTAEGWKRSLKKKINKKSAKKN